MKILLAVDGSVHSRWAEGLLAQVTGPGHSVEVLVVGPVVPTGSSVGAALADGLRKSGQGLVDTVAKSLSPRYKTTGRVLVSHDVAGTLLDRARAIRAELIVLGARGLSPLKQFLLGSVSNKVARHAECSVLIAHRKPSKKPSLLCPIDGSPADRRTADFLRRLGTPEKAPVTLFHVVADPVALWIPETGFPGGYGNVVAYKESLDALRRRGKTLLARARDQWARRFSSVKALLREGYPSSEILHVAQSGRFGLVVLGRRGMGRVDRFFMGSVSQKVSSYAPCGVLVVH
ncbi:MAG: universal stress protein [Elusimicrobia bacterium]|nr:universal stress protein [Elusimicrobiota bacterium]